MFAGKKIIIFDLDGTLIDSINIWNQIDVELVRRISGLEIDFEDIRYVIVLIILLTIIGVIFVKMDLYYGNPTLALLGYKIYRATLKGIDAPDGVILITKSKLTKGKSIKWIPLDKYLWVAKERK